VVDAVDAPPAQRVLTESARQTNGQLYLTGWMIAQFE
jgi:hypothetical protein